MNCPICDGPRVLQTIDTGDATVRYLACARCAQRWAETSPGQFPDTAAEEGRWAAEATQAEIHCLLIRTPDDAGRQAYALGALSSFHAQAMLTARGPGTIEAKLHRIQILRVQLLVKLRAQLAEGGAL